jgi:hypothetical protein
MLTKDLIIDINLLIMQHLGSTLLHSPNSNEMMKKMTWVNEN